MARKKSGKHGRRPTSGKDDRSTGAQGWSANAQWVGLGALVVAVVSGLVWWTARPAPESTGIAVTVPALSPVAKTGQAAFRRQCAVCHGETAAGTAKGPALVHAVYRPSHHGDDTFRRAIAFGVRRHHWRFGDMPPQREVEGGEVGAIIAYVRELQRANGIN